MFSRLSLGFADAYRFARRESVFQSRDFADLVQGELEGRIVEEGVKLVIRYRIINLDLNAGLLNHFVKHIPNGHLLQLKRDLWR